MYRVALLMRRLGLIVNEYEAPNSKASGGESGADVVVVCNGCRVGIQVTDLDTGEELGQARKAETRLARNATSRGSTYGTFAQNDPDKVVAAIARSISRKARMSFAGFDEFWLLLCCGVPEFGAIAATFVMTPWLDTGSLDNATLDKLARSKYSRAFIHAILELRKKRSTNGSAAVVGRNQRCRCLLRRRGRTSGNTKTTQNCSPTLKGGVSARWSGFLQNCEISQGSP